MKNFNYTKLPSSAQWRQDSSVALAFRKHDIALTRIDELIDDYHGEKEIGKRGLILCDMFLTLEYWFKMLETHAGKFEAGRLPAMRALFAVVVKDLGPFFADRDGHVASPTKISTEMKKYFGAGLSNHGYKNDEEHGMVAFDKKQLYKYRLWFKNGLAYQFPWWTKGQPSVMVLANSRHGYTRVVRPGGGGVPQIGGWSAFVMTMDRQIYMTKHDFDPKRFGSNHFHSSYNGGQRVAMAGTIAINNGVITGVRTDSGHYQPGLHNLNAFLWALKMYHVDLRKISLLDEKGDWVGGDILCTAEDFFYSGRTWDEFRKGGEREQQKLDSAQLRREARWA